jgi:CDP-diacylglycerol--serine O-phosphatidyltransferase
VTAPFRRGVRRRRSRRRGDRRRAIFVLPNLVTTTALLLGFWSITQSWSGRFGFAALGIVLAGVCDMLDGRIARATHTQSKFGVQYDSLSDLISFGVAPSLLVYGWALEPLGRRGWVIAALFAICAALRLARFNVQTEAAPRRHYQGLPSTTAGAMVAVSVWFVSWLGQEPPFGRALGGAIAAGFAGLALLMVSVVPYPSWKSLPLSGPRAFPTLLGLILGVVLLLLYQEPAFFLIGSLYILSGPVLWFWSRRPGALAAPATDPPPSPDRDPRESPLDGR